MVHQSITKFSSIDFAIKSKLEITSISYLVRLLISLESLSTQNLAEFFLIYSVKVYSNEGNFDNRKRDPTLLVNGLNTYNIEVVAKTLVIVTVLMKISGNRDKYILESGDRLCTFKTTWSVQLDLDISLGECNTILSAYTKYRHSG